MNTACTGSIKLAEYQTRVRAEHHACECIVTNIKRLLNKNSRAQHPPVAERQQRPARRPLCRLTHTIYQRSRLIQCLPELADIRASNVSQLCIPPRHQGAKAGGRKRPLSHSSQPTRKAPTKRTPQNRAMMKSPLTGCRRGRRRTLYRSLRSD